MVLGEEVEALHSQTQYFGVEPLNSKQRSGEGVENFRKYTSQNNLTRQSIIATHVAQDNNITLITYVYLHFRFES